MAKTPTDNKGKDISIILFLCNWSPHSAYHALLDQGYAMPAQMRMIRIPCTGRITKALLFKAFEMGADGVALLGCKSGTCRYGSGTDAATNNTEDTRKILDLAGIGPERMKMATFYPDETVALKEFLETFRDEIIALGKSPVVPSGGLRLEDRTALPPFAEILTRYNAYECQDCGKCTASCPLALSGRPFSPRALVGAIIAGEAEKVNNDIWACLTCGICYDRCPSGVNFPDFVRDVRCELIGSGERHATHGGFFQSLMRAMTSPDLRTRRWGGLPESVKTDPDSPILFFGGCAPFFDAFFRKHTGVGTTGILEDSLRLLNFFDIRPAVLEHERCCGHDLLWSGDRENFLKLARLNVEAIRTRRTQEVITACPECWRTLAVDYPAHGIDIGFKVTHLYEILAEKIENGAFSFKPLERRFTFQDSCRMNRFEQLRDLPRRLIQRIAPDAFAEMKDHGASSICCGNCAWIGCDAFSKAMQVNRLGQAHASGAELLVTACPKCQVHLRCAMEDPLRGEELEMEMMDLTGVIARTLKWE
ncbi:MAG: hydrogenase iron-sulfur subunit [Thermodesulfobacteriota bacterium]